MYMWRASQQVSEEDCKYHYEQSEKSKAEVGRLKAILANKGIQN